jgi:ATP-binding cassette subfamily F protein uup
MGILIGCEDLGHEWPGRKVLEGQSLGIYEGDRIGVVGRNGEGKSTLLELLAKRYEPDEGTVTWRGGVSVGVLAQDDALDDADTVIHQVTGDVAEYEWAGDARIRSIIDELLAGIDRGAAVGELSGGQRRRVDLARLLVGSWDVLLLDEPTNHLDVHGIAWLADHLRHRWPAGRGALVVVTHDRWFLDEVCTSMWEVHDRRVEPFEGGFSAYVQQRVERERQAAVAEERRQNMLRRELAWLSRGAQARSTKPKFRVEEAKSLVADVPELRNPIELRRLSVARLGKQVIEMQDVHAGYPGREVLSGVDWIIGPGDRVGIVGANGAGKSTLLQVMSGRLEPTSGRVRIGKSVRFGILTQRLESFDELADWTPREILSRHKRYHVIEGKEYSSEQLFERLGFEHADLLTPLADLSGGQRRRLALLLVIIDEPNVLVLDEPGNDMDTDMLAVMEDLLDSWPGTLILVTHDRYLMERVVDDEYALMDGTIRHLPRGIDEYLELLEEEQDEVSTRQKGSERPGSKAGEEPKEGAKHASPSGLTNKERQELKRRLDSVSRRLETRSGRPDEIRARLEAADPTDYQELERLQGELEAAEADLSALEDEWLELSERLEA